MGLILGIVLLLDVSLDNCRNYWRQHVSDGLAGFITFMLLSFYFFVFVSIVPFLRWVYEEDVRYAANTIWAFCTKKVTQQHNDSAQSNIRHDNTNTNTRPGITLFRYESIHTEYDINTEDIPDDMSYLPRYTDQA